MLFSRRFPPQLFQFRREKPFRSLVKKFLTLGVVTRPHQAERPGPEVTWRIECDKFERVTQCTVLRHNANRLQVHSRYLLTPLLAPSRWKTCPGSFQPAAGHLQPGRRVCDFSVLRRHGRKSERVGLYKQHHALANHHCGCNCVYWVSEGTSFTTHNGHPQSRTGAILRTLQAFVHLNFVFGFDMPLDECGLFFTHSPR